MATSRMAILGLLFVFGYIFAQNITEKSCECPQGNKAGCICVIPRWCGADNVILTDLPVSTLGEDRSGNGYSKCVENEEICCRLPHSVRARMEAECGGSFQHGILTEDTGFVTKKQYPWLMGIFLKNKKNYNYYCWGSLIHPQVVVTATHCLQTVNTKRLKKDKIKIVSNFISSDALDHEDDERQEKFAKKIIFHSPYIPKNLTNDISLILLDSPMSINEYVQPVCLPPPNFQFEEYKRCVVAGWERTNRRPKLLKNIEVPLIEQSNCEKLFRRTVELGAHFDLHASFICAGGEVGKDTCVGDAGSPLVCDYGTGQAYQVGLVSWGVVNTCGARNVPAAYVNVPIFVRWIKNTLRGEGIDL